MRTITISETQLVQMRGLGWDSKRIATHYGITTSEVSDALEYYGLAKYRSNKKNYNIEYKKDLVKIIPPIPVSEYSINN